MKYLHISYKARLFKANAFVVAAFVFSQFAGIPAFTASAHAANPSTFHNLDEIRSTVEQYLQQRLADAKQNDYELFVTKPNARLKLHACAQELQVSDNTNDLVGKITVTVHCKDDKPWKLFVSADISSYILIPVSANTIARGETINSSDITKVRMQLTSAGGNILQSEAAIIGKVARRTIAKGKTFSFGMLTQPKLVLRGQEVMLVARSSALEVRMKGKALSDGAMGELIKVRNHSSNRVVEGIVTRLGIVQVDM